MDLATSTCRVPGCGGPASGVCINNLSFDECPDVVEAPALPIEDTKSESEQPTTPPQKSTAVMTGGGISLDSTACDRLLRERGGSVIGIVAGPEVGKTTMIAAVYEHVTRGKIDGVQFAGSETLRGYEERCHLSRLTSNGSTPDTVRTRTSAKLSFTHIRIRLDSAMHDVIFSDRSGEHFDNVLDRPHTISEFSELTRADIILLVVDLHAFTLSPHEQTSHLRRMVMAMHGADQLAGKKVRLVGTKADLMQTDAELNKATAELNSLAADLTARAPGTAILPVIVASRRGSGPATSGRGFDHILDLIRPETINDRDLVENHWPSEPTELDLLMRPYRRKSK